MAWFDAVIPSPPVADPASPLAGRDTLRIVRRVAILLMAAHAFPLVATPASSARSQLVINEVLASHVGDDNTEFIEIHGTPGVSLDGMSLICVEGDASSTPGVIDRRFDFGPANDGSDSTTYRFVLDVTNVVPEPSSFMLCLMGILTLGACVWRRRMSPAPCR